jgi:hypothetical protein
MCNSQAIVNSFAQRLLQLDGTGNYNQYFNLSLRCLYMLVLTGNFRQPGTEPIALNKAELLPKCKLPQSGKIGHIDHLSPFLIDHASPAGKTTL